MKTTRDLCFFFPSPFFCCASSGLVLLFFGREGAPQNDDAAMEERETAYAQLITAEPEFLVSEVRKRRNASGRFLCLVKRPWVMVML